MRPGEVTVAAYMPDPVVHYLARRVNITAKVTTTSERSEVPRGVSVSSTRGLQSDSSSPGAWGLRITDEVMDEVIGRLYTTRSLRVDGRLVIL